MAAKPACVPLDAADHGDAMGWGRRDRFALFPSGCTWSASQGKPGRTARRPALAVRLDVEVRVARTLG